MSALLCENIPRRDDAKLELFKLPGNAFLRGTEKTCKEILKHTRLDFEAIADEIVDSLSKNHLF